MTLLLRIVAKTPVPKSLRLHWQRILVDRAYRKDMELALKAKDREKVHDLEHNRRFEISFIEEEEDQLLTNNLIRSARRLRVPIPHRFDADGKPSEFWCEGQYLGGWYLTDSGISKVREEVRKELRARHDSRAQWVAWVSALTGVIGALTGLIAVLSHK